MHQSIEKRTAPIYLKVNLKMRWLFKTGGTGIKDYFQENSELAADHCYLSENKKEVHAKR